MTSLAAKSSNFSHLSAHDEQLVRLGLLAERYFAEDPNTCLLKLRQLTELLAQLIASKIGLYVSPEEKQVDLLRRLQDHGIVPREVGSLFAEVRKAGNAANHRLDGDPRTALTCLRLTWQLSLWFHRTFKDAAYKSGPFVPPTPSGDESAELQAELAQLRVELDKYRVAHNEATQQLDATRSQAQQSEEERAFWENMAAEAEAAKSELSKRLETMQAQAEAQPGPVIAQFVTAANTAASAIQINEADTRKLIDEQLAAAGWTVDSSSLTYAKGARPQRNKNLAIAEWPTETGPADYVLFVGLTPVAVIEAKRKNIDVSGALQQAKRYSRTFRASEETVLPEINWGEEGAYRVPFAFASNGRPYLRQLATKSGVWFCDLRRAENRSHALDGWYTPKGLTDLIKRDEAKAHEQLDNAPFNYGFSLRYYQQDAIRAAEQAIEAGQREMLLAMATGTGKTKTCIALIYRLLKAQRFNRILFLVDRSALGIQAADAFKDTRMENLQTFADIFGIKELEEQTPDDDTMVHIATVQGMVQRVLFTSDETNPPAVDQYDCIVVDECHRGYLLDRELSDTELTFRGYDDYISKYRRVLDYFDAVKVGLTATPALHTSKIFGPPIYTYSYREAVIDGFLVDYEPPIQITTELSANGIQWKVGENVQVYDTKRDQIELYKTPDAIKLDVEDFNRKVITKNFNEVVCEYLAQELDPSSRRKTLIFCATDAHADLVVDLLKQAFVTQYGSVEDDAVIKITGAADKPLQLIRRYKNEKLPNVAVTVDLLTTGIDVPEICNLVFLRRVNSRILFDQMLGRATRLCDEIEKDAFRVFDAVQIFEALQNMTAMQPVVADPKISFTQLVKELASVTDDEARALVRDQFLAKLQRKKRHLGEKSGRDFETRAGMSPDAFIQKLRAMPLADVAAWFTQNPDLGEILDRKGDGPREPIFISEHPDQLKAVERGYGQAKKPEDYLNEFTAFIKSHSNTIPALMTVLTRPRELTRKQLRELVMELDKAGFTETGLSTAWREMTNHDIAARIVGYIRQAAIGDPLLPYGERVDRALQHLLAHPPGGTPWTTPQRDWLKRIAAQTKANVLVDRAALDDPDLIFKREGGGFSRLDKIFNGQLQPVLESFNDALWVPLSQSA
ncbi:type I restriction-modification system endonuclease [Thiobacillus sp.]|uniref:type I restriction-modification system endonuclease n=1 Tax=Thiobacillus sp. TaxID=924 RepID=UPI0017C7AFD7|nr:type I restriction-modification system endonuclease [Thiobacillus sp.]MBC2731495.1 type I restriction-modification system endonuclease [Thiobacillus sp.]MBC2740234.1 type I restriction-modification system endonuclease [Thiobacillus sp.]MBC2758447.1 type I restriction-modification system endonuclease [Thiobacillus sp.]